MAGSRTYIPAMPQIFVSAWFERVWPKRLAEHSSASTGTILDPPDISETARLATSNVAIENALDVIRRISAGTNRPNPRQGPA